MHRTLLVTAIFLAASTIEPLSAAPSPDETRPEAGVLQAPSGPGAELVTSARAPVAGVSHRALALGREVYSDLVRLQDAARRRDEIDTRLALNDASRVLGSFYDSDATRALQQQAAIIRRDLAREGAEPGPGLWLPLKAELDHAEILAPAEDVQRAKQAVAEGRAAAAEGDRGKAGQRLRALEDVLDYRWALLPLGQIRGDIRSAEMALSPEPPYWKGIAEAAGSALAAVRWVTTTDASGWLSAYDDAVDARLALPEDPAQARVHLRQAAENLQSLAGAGGLAQEARRLADQPTPDVDGVDALMRSLRAGVPKAPVSG